MNACVAVTDNNWFDQLRRLAAKAELAEVNFWRPSGISFRALQEGEMFLFKLHAPRNVIAGGGFFSRAVQLSVHLAWQAFGLANGVTSEAVLRESIAHYRGQSATGVITSLILSEPFFFPVNDSVPVPPDFARQIVTYKRYDLTHGSGRELYAQVCERLRRAPLSNPGPALAMVLESRFGAPQLIAPRLGQGGFRIGVLENYRRRCAISGERTVPVLEAAHIQRYSDHGGHELRNGLLLRSDLHRLFDLGYLAVDPDQRRVLVSPRIREEFENGRDYYSLMGKFVAEPAEPSAALDPQRLRFHLEHVYRA